MTANQLRMARSSLRLTIRELARLADINHMTINRFETEKGGLNHTTQRKSEKCLKQKTSNFLRPAILQAAMELHLNDKWQPEII